MTHTALKDLLPRKVFPQGSDGPAYYVAKDVDAAIAALSAMEAVAWAVVVDGKASFADVSRDSAESEASIYGTGPKVEVRPLIYGDTAPPPQQAYSSEVPSPIYYMRDNHTFKKLSVHLGTAMEEIEAEFDAGYTSGMLCSKRPGFKDVHAAGTEKKEDFLKDCYAALRPILGATA